MLEVTLEPEDLSPEEREARRAERVKVDKKQKVKVHRQLSKSIFATLIVAHRCSYLQWAFI